ncbi:M23 family metallopeptidase [Argonema galeatum]|uniref:M23 family metallopeptidase n=1 Tax=Argonema galeatum TaxID=2942762 RepID=UPI002011976D|nr:M23 family metallopeptidase [Argonema galeatum]MCL1464621.1 peptidoglycan DD-metalloendopeptidase family protein [Argonema galeatum A003/A1]
MEPVYGDKQLKFKSREDRQIEVTISQSTPHEQGKSAPTNSSSSFWQRFLLVQGIGWIGGLGILGGGMVWAKNQTPSEGFVVAQIPDVMPKAVPQDPAPEARREAAPVFTTRTRPRTAQRSRLGRAGTTSPSVASNNNNSYIDPTDYSLGATRRRDLGTSSYKPPSSVVLSERSTGCQRVFSGGGASGRCGSAAVSRIRVRRNAVASDTVSGRRRQRTRDIPRFYQASRQVRPTQTDRAVRSYQAYRQVRPTQTDRAVRSYQAYRQVRPTQTDRAVRSYQASRQVRPTQTDRAVRSYQASRQVRPTQTDLQAGSYQLSRLPRPTQSDRSVRSYQQSRLTVARQSEDLPRSYRISRLPQTRQSEDLPRSYRISRLPQTRQSEDLPRSYRISRLPQTQQSDDLPRSYRISRLPQAQQSDDLPRSYRISRLPQTQQSDDLPRSYQKKRLPIADRITWKSRRRDVRVAAIGKVNISPINISPRGIGLGKQGDLSTRSESTINSEIRGNETLPNPALTYYYKQGQPSEAEVGNSNLPIIFPLAVPAEITSVFGWRIHPISGDRRFHSGTDLGAPMGTPVLAAHAGKVAIADFLGGYGLSVVLRHNNDTQETRYNHLSEVLVQPGEWVEPGTAIGRVGSTGNSTGPHLHFEVREQTPQGWIAIDPRAQLEYSLAQLVKIFKTAQATQEPKAYEKPQQPQANSQPPDSEIPNIQPSEVPLSKVQPTNSQLPEITVPQTQETNSQLPEITVPQTQETNSQLPEITVPQTQETNSQLPEIPVPQTQETNSQLPEATIPKAQPINSDSPEVPLPNSQPSNTH